MLRGFIRLVVLSLCMVLVACSSVTERSDRAPSSPKSVETVENAIPKDEPRSKYGNPVSYEVLGKRYYTLKSSKGYKEKGIASWYGTKFHGRRTSSGDTYNMYAMTAAHKTLPLPTYVEVTNLDNGLKVIVKVNDRGPFHEGRIIDLSYTAAKKLGITAKGTGRVEVRAITANSAKANVVKATTPILQTAPVSNNTGVYLQVGAFRTAASATKLQTEVQQKIDDTVLIMPLFKPEGTLYRVRVGPLMSAQYGNSLAERIANLGFNDTHIVVE